MIVLIIIIYIMPKAGLEPAWIAPYAPETHVSTIPPLRHKFLKYSIVKNHVMPSGGCSHFCSNPLEK